MSVTPPSSPVAPPLTEGLAAGAQSGNIEAFGALYTRVAPSVFVWVSLRIPRELQSKLDPEDAMQEIWARALSRFSTFDRERGSFRQWLFGIAGRVLLESLRRTHRLFYAVAHNKHLRVDVTLEEVPDEVTSQSRRLARDERIRRFLDQVRQLAPEDRQLLLFRGIEGLPHEDCAARLSISASTCMKRWQRLREALADSDGAWLR